MAEILFSFSSRSWYSCHKCWNRKVIIVAFSPLSVQESVFTFNDHMLYDIKFIKQLINDNLQWHCGFLLNAIQVYVCAHMLSLNCSGYLAAVTVLIETPTVDNFSPVQSGAMAKNGGIRPRCKKLTWGRHGALLKGLVPLGGHYGNNRHGNLQKIGAL